MKSGEALRGRGAGSLYNNEKFIDIFSIEEETNIGIMIKAYDGVYRIQLEDGYAETEWEPYSETNYTIENTSNLPQITTKNGVTHILVENTSYTKLAASYQYIKTVVQ